MYCIAWTNVPPKKKKVQKLIKLKKKIAIHKAGLTCKLQFLSTAKNTIKRTKVKYTWINDPKLIVPACYEPEGAALFCTLQSEKVDF